ncbi:hypothetical protein ACOME3_004338 [Neoechinorhynchus agilis]
MNESEKHSLAFLRAAHCGNTFVRETEYSMSSNYEPSKLLEIAFMLDCTGSMSNFIDTLKKEIQAIVDDIIASKQHPWFIEFRDHEEDWIVKHNDLTTDIHRIYDLLDKAEAFGGGDAPEAMADAMNCALNDISWTGGSQKLAFMLTDSIPHGIARIGDSYPEGCPCGFDPILLAKEMASKSITLFPVTSGHEVEARYWSGISHITGGRLFFVRDQRVFELRKPIVDCALEDTSVEELMTRIHREINEEALQTGGEVDEVELTRRLQEAITLRGGGSAVVGGNNEGLTSAQLELFLRLESQGDCKRFLQTLPHSNQIASPRGLIPSTASVSRGGRIERERRRPRKRSSKAKKLKEERPPVRKSLRLAFKEGKIPVSDDDVEDIEEDDKETETDSESRHSGGTKEDRKGDDNKGGCVPNAETGSHVEERNESMHNDQEADPAIRRAVRKAVARMPTRNSEDEKS